MQHYDRKDFEACRALIRRKLHKRYLNNFDYEASKFRKEMRIIHTSCRVVVMETGDLSYPARYGELIRQSQFMLKQFTLDSLKK